MPYTAATIYGRRGWPPREIQLGAPYWITPISKDGAEQRLASSI